MEYVASPRINLSLRNIPSETRKLPMLIEFDRDATSSYGLEPIMNLSWPAGEGGDEFEEAIFPAIESNRDTRTERGEGGASDALHVSHSATIYCPALQAFRKGTTRAHRMAGYGIIAWQQPNRESKAERGLGHRRQENSSALEPHQEDSVCFHE